MPARARRAYCGAAIGVALMVVTWYVAHEVAFARHVDASVLGGFMALGRPRLDELTNAVAALCDPMPYVLLAAVPVAIALLRRRPRLALTIVVLLIGANVSAELLKPLLGGPRDHVPGAFLSHETWPSGHATASMSLALAMVVSVPSRWRAVTAAAMATFTVAIVYSFLELGWHYPSDVLGGFEIACVWTLVAVGTLWTYEAHRPELATRQSPRFSLRSMIVPPLTMVGCGVVVAALVTAARPHAVLGYAAAHTQFVVGAAVIGELAFAIAAGFEIVLQRPAGAARRPAGAAQR